MTAGHVFKDVDDWLSQGRIRLLKCGLADYFSAEAMVKEPTPFVYEDAHSNGYQIKGGVRANWNYFEVIPTVRYRHIFDSDDVGIGIQGLGCPGYGICITAGYEYLKQSEDSRYFAGVRCDHEMRGAVDDCEARARDALADERAKPAHRRMTCFTAHDERGDVDRRKHIRRQRKAVGARPIRDVHGRRRNCVLAHSGGPRGKRAGAGVRRLDARQVQQGLAGRAEDVHVERVLEGQRTVRHVGGDDQHFSGMHGDLTLVVVAEPQAQGSFEDVGQLLVLMAVPRDVITLFEVDVGDHGALTGDDAPGDGPLEGFLGYAIPAVVGHAVEIGGHDCVLLKKRCALQLRETEDRSAPRAR